MLDIKVYITMRDSTVTRQDLRKEKRFHRPDLGLFCARTGVLQRRSGLVNRLHTTEDGSKAPDSKYNHRDFDLSNQQWTWLCMPSTDNPYTGYRAARDSDTAYRPRVLSRPDPMTDSRADSVVVPSTPARSSTVSPARSSAGSPPLQTASMVTNLLTDPFAPVWTSYPNRWPRWTPPDLSIALTRPGCTCELTGVVDHTGGAPGYGCLVCPFGEGQYDGVAGMKDVFFRRCVRRFCRQGFGRRCWRWLVRCFGPSVCRFVWQWSERW